MKIQNKFYIQIFDFRETSTLSPYNKPSKNFSQAHYSLDTDKLDFYRRIVNLESKKYQLVNYTHVSWADKILQANESCFSENKVIMRAQKFKI